MHKFGDVMWLLAATKEYQHWKFSRLQYIFMPPVNLQQFFLFYEDGLPICFCSYAFVSDDVLAELQTGVKGHWFRPSNMRTGHAIT
jgi:hemolysin-activating ACP:hemolysin acyltransferase